MKNKPSYTLLLPLCSLLLLLPATALAQHSETTAEAEETAEVAEETAGVAETAEETAGETRYQTVTVTAQKREQEINDIGATINVFNAQELDNFGVESPEDLEMLTPGLTITEALPNGIPVFTIRGVGFSDFSTAGSSTVGLYMDQVHLPYPVMGRGLLVDVERVEILKGPQGDLYGRNTTGGQINFISRKPTSDFEMLTKGTIGNYGNNSFLGSMAYNLEGSVSGSVTNNAQARIAGKYIYSGNGWQQALLPSEDSLGRKGEGIVRGLLNVDLSDSLSVMVNLHYFNTTSDNTAPVPYDTSPLYDRWEYVKNFRNFKDPKLSIKSSNSRNVSWSIRPRRNNDLYGTMISFDWDISEAFSLISISAFNGFQRKENFDISGVSFEDGAYSDNTSINAFSQDINLNFNPGGNITAISGLYYSFDHINSNTLMQADESVILATVSSRYRQTTQSAALFARAEWQLPKDFRLSFGGRYTHENRKWAGCSYESEDNNGLSKVWQDASTQFHNPLFTDKEIVRQQSPLLYNGFQDSVLTENLSKGQCGTFNDLENTPNAGEFAPYSNKISANRFMWRLTLDFTPTDNLMLYATISEGFKSGGFNGSLAMLHSQLAPYRPETLIAYELGSKIAALSGALQLNTSLFYYDYKDKQESTIAVTPVGNLGALTNVPQSRIFGVETNLNLFLMRNLSLGFNALYLNTKIRKYLAICQEKDRYGCENASVFPETYYYNASGLSLPNSPEFQASFSIQYTQNLPYNLNMIIGGDLNYKDNNASSIQDFIPSYTLFNARIAFAPYGDNWRFTIWGRNVFDAVYWIAASQSICCRTRTYGEPASYGITASMNF